jgi:hypothetical protein
VRGASHQTADQFETFVTGEMRERPVGYLPKGSVRNDSLGRWCNL